MSDFSRLFPTRTSSGGTATLSSALLDPAAPLGGLWAPKELPKLPDSLPSDHYARFAAEVIALFGFDVSKELIKNALGRYDSFDDKNPAHISRLNDNLYQIELWHGPTRAFKDLALQPFGSLLQDLAKAQNKEYLIICATSGDTGPATLQTFAECQNIRVVCIYPQNGTSEVQRLQMTTANAKNLKTIGIKGDFDDAQRALKSLLNDDGFKNDLSQLNLSLSAANSVNFGRILFQIIYHAFATANLASKNEPINIIVPSGNFGNALGAYYAKKMGANIAKIKIASNANNILTDLFKTGVYDLRDRALIHTTSPAMDILISSNVERLLFDKFGANRTNELMKSLNENRFYKLTNSELIELQRDFEADFCTDSECEKYINSVATSGVLVDPHTATCFKLANSEHKSVICSTAQWVKFAPSMAKAIKIDSHKNELEAMREIAKRFNVLIPQNIQNLFKSSEIHTQVVPPDSLKAVILEWLKR